MKKCFYIVLFSFLLGNYQLHSQEKIVNSKYAYAEKIYLQLSSTVFTTDNTIWFKSIVTDLTLVPTQLSGVIHVELVDFDKRIISKKLLKIEKGVANGFFDLNNKMSAGRYQVRAYTEWNKNFGKEFISQTYIDIYASKKVLEKEEPIRDISLSETAPNIFELSAKVYPRLLDPKYRGDLKMYIHTESKTDSVQLKRGKGNEYVFQYQLPKDVVKARIELKLGSVKLRNNNEKFVNSYSKTVAINKEYLDFQFFPEGGRLVDRLTSKVAFKALDYKNQGTVVIGYIVDENDEIVMPFKSNNLGMGVLYLTANSQKTYYARIKGKDGIVYKYELPEVSKTGVVLNIKESQEYIVIGLNSNELNKAQLSVKVQSCGVELDSFYIELKEGKASVALEKHMLPEGLLMFTISNKQAQIVCERLFFNYKEEDRISISAIPNLSHYRQRDKIIINISAKDKDSIAIKSSLSVLVINKEQLEVTHDMRSNLLSYFLLNSELRGTIEQPSSYFNQKNKRRKHDMDALVLTQGWSNYKYENTEPMLEFKFLPEKSLSVSGRVRNLIMSNNKLKSPVDLTMVYGPLNVVTQQVGSNGRFQFYLEDYYKDKFRVLIQSKNKRGKKKNFMIGIDKYLSPKVNYLKEVRIEEVDSVNVFVKGIIARKKAEQDFEISNGTISLDEVELSSYKLTPKRREMMKRYGEPDVVIENEELVSKVEKWHSGLYSVLESNYPNDIYFTYSDEGYLIANVYDADRTMILIDGIRVKYYNYAGLENLPIDEIKSIELIKRPNRTDYYEGEFLMGTEVDINIDDEDVVVEGEPIIDANEMIKRTSIISIYTYTGKGYNGLSSPKGIFKGFVPGFTPEREFYAPKYEANSFNYGNTPDLRSVVYWAPNVITDSEGDTKVEFYNSDNIGEMLIIVEGITENGKIGCYQTTYRVDKNTDR